MNDTVTHAVTQKPYYEKDRGRDLRVVFCFISKKMFLKIRRTDSQFTGLTKIFFECLLTVYISDFTALRIIGM